MDMTTVYIYITNQINVTSKLHSTNQIINCKLIRSEIIILIIDIESILLKNNLVRTMINSIRVMQCCTIIMVIKQ